MRNPSAILADLNEQSTDTAVIETIRAIFKGCKAIKSVRRFPALEMANSRHFIINLDSPVHVHKAVELLGGNSSHCKTFAESSVLLRIDG